MFCGARVSGVAKTLLSVGIFYSLLALALLFTPLILGFIIFDVVTQQKEASKSNT